MSGQRDKPIASRLVIENILHKIPVCSHLSQAQLAALKAMGSIETADAGTLLFNEQDLADKVYPILSGAVRVFKKEGDGHESELGTLETGEFFGEMALFDRGLRSAAVHTLTPCEFFVFDGEEFLSMALD